ncbi:FkbM family methyltransferase [Rhodobacterales bacterium HKCCA1288]|nr:FkbM family methyltransferase [Rhodobacterales bacterium HKCCA1288]
MLKLSEPAINLTKQEFINLAYETYHKNLFEYSKILSGTGISEIIIKSGEVWATCEDTGIKFKCSEGDKRIAPIEAINFSGYETSLTQVLFNYASSSRTFVDVGANIGWYSLNLAQKFPTLKVYSYEPIKHTYDILIDNIVNASLENVQVQNCGCSDEHRRDRFYFSPTGSGNASKALLDNPNDSIIVDVQLVKLDDEIWFKENPIDLIKIDVEGAEKFVIEGALKLIKRDRPVLVVELLRKWSIQFGYHPQQVVDMLKKLKYLAFAIGEDRNYEIDEINDDTQETNFLFVPCEKLINCD